MTVIGKILTFLVFFLSLVFLGFAVSVNMLNKDTVTGESWRTVAMKLRDNRKQVEADLGQKDIDIAQLRAGMNKVNKDLDEAKANWKKEVTQAQIIQGQAEARAEQATTNFINSQLAAKAARDELEVRRKAELDALAMVKQKDITISDMQAERTKLTNEKVQAQVGLGTFMDRARGLEKQVQSLTKQLEEERVAAGERSRIDPAQALVPRPPPDDVKGIVKSVAADGLVSISIGSDAGLLRGHTLEVFRTEPKAEYLGRIQIIDINAHEAVGRMLTPKFSKLVKANDQVASSITGSVRAGK